MIKAHLNPAFSLENKENEHTSVGQELTASSPRPVFMSTLRCQVSNVKTAQNGLDSTETFDGATFAKRQKTTADSVADLLGLEILSTVQLHQPTEKLFVVAIIFKKTESTVCRRCFSFRREATTFSSQKATSQWKLASKTE